MNLFKKFFQKKEAPSKPKEDFSSKDNLSTDELFVRKFISKGGKFLYCQDKDEVKTELSKILLENEWNNVVCFDNSLNEILSDINTQGHTQPAIFYCL